MIGEGVIVNIGGRRRPLGVHRAPRREPGDRQTGQKTLELSHSAHSDRQLRRGQYNKTTIPREIPVARWAQTRQGRRRAWPRKLPALAVVKIPKVRRLPARRGSSRDKS